MKHSRRKYYRRYIRSFNKDLNRVWVCLYYYQTIGKIPEKIRWRLYSKILKEKGVGVFDEETQKKTWKKKLGR